jgi:hypothetical protein
MLVDPAIIGTAVGIVIGLAILAALVAAGSRLFGLQLDAFKVVSSSLAAANAAVFFIAKGQFWASLARNFNPGVAESLCALAGYFASLAVLAVCLFAFASMPFGLGWTLSMFANGGAATGTGLLLMVGGTGLKMPTLPPASLILVCAGLILLAAGYLLGAGHQPDAPEPIHDFPNPHSKEFIMPNENPSFRRTIMPAPFEPDAVPTTKHETTAKRVTTVSAEKAQPGSGAWIVITIGKDKGKKFDLSSGDSKIGAGSDCRIRVTGDDEISSQHCLIRCSDGRYELHDLASRNGTSLNGNPIREARSLLDGDRITLGQTQLTFKKV